MKNHTRKQYTIKQQYVLPNIAHNIEEFKGNMTFIRKTQYGARKD